jgi:calcium-translocating P-type ATPase
LGYIGAVFIGLSFLFKQFVMDQNYEWARIVAYMSNWQLALKDGVTALILGIIIIVVAVPEGLPMMIAIVLSLNMSKLLSANVLVRKLLGIETAGSLNILFSDKTGTLTRGKLETHMLLTGDKKKFMTAESVPSQLQKLITFSVLNSTAAHINADGNIVGGNASDRAFVAWVPHNTDLASASIKREREVLFTSEIKFSASQLLVPSNILQSIPFVTHAKQGSDARVTIVKGAPEKVIPNCSHFYNSDGTTAPLKNSSDLEDTIANLSHKGMRVVALALTSEQLTEQRPAVMPGKLTLVGILALKDEIRPESAKALRMAKQAGIQVVMITGDRVETAVAIAKEIELLPSATKGDELVNSPNVFGKNAVITSHELHNMTDERLAAVLPDLRVVARALPTDKSRLVRVAQSLNLVVGMTGDGVNDAAALKKADVGFAMGSGTEVAKEASDLVILDDNFYSIATSVLYGRTIFKSIRKFIVFQSTINVASTLIVFLGPFMGFDFPLTLIQLLWVNLVMDTLAALAFGGEPALPRFVSLPPRKPTGAR